MTRGQRPLASRAGPRALGPAVSAPAARLAGAHREYPAPPRARGITTGRSQTASTSGKMCREDGPCGTRPGRATSCAVSRICVGSKGRGRLVQHQHPPGCAIAPLPPGRPRDGDIPWTAGRSRACAQLNSQDRADDVSIRLRRSSGIPRSRRESRGLLLDLHLGSGGIPAGRPRLSAAPDCDWWKDVKAVHSRRAAGREGGKQVKSSRRRLASPWEPGSHDLPLATFEADAGRRPHGP